MKERINIQWRLVAYDIVIFLLISLLVYLISGIYQEVNYKNLLLRSGLMIAILMSSRIAFNVYRKIWRFASVDSYIGLIFADFIAAVFYILAQFILPISYRAEMLFLGICMLNTLIALAMRMIYRFIYKYGVSDTRSGKFYQFLLNIFAGKKVTLREKENFRKINIAIVGAGRVGCSLIEELRTNPSAYYYPCFFIENDLSKVGKKINKLKVYDANDDICEKIKAYKIKEVVIAISDMDDNHRTRLLDFYKKLDCKVKVYDYPVTRTANSKRSLRDFDIEDLMPRNPIAMKNDSIKGYFKGRNILITGGGGSIGSEMGRQIATMNPNKLVLLDIYENGVYELQQELLMSHKGDFELAIEIVSITDKKALDLIFKQYDIDIVIHAAAHKHVPLMEHNAVEAIKNNIFGTRNVIEIAEKYKIQKFMMVSTDKAVNPTNIMGATKRFCEMMILAASKNGNVSYGATRFGNVLGSAGSVIPLFRRQIMNGGPITITDKRIIRYFMTIPEACNLVLHATKMTNNGELFVLDMGKPVKILDLAKDMISVSGAHDIEIIETGLRPGEKLFEEILVSKDSHKKTDNDLIFVENEYPNINSNEIADICNKLDDACEKSDKALIKKYLKEAVPEYQDPEIVNKKANLKI